MFFFFGVEAAHGLTEGGVGLVEVGHGEGDRGFVGALAGFHVHDPGLQAAETLVLEAVAFVVGVLHGLIGIVVPTKFIIF